MTTQDQQNQAAMDWYNAHYNNATYQKIWAVLQDTGNGLIAEFMNMVIDAALEKSGYLFYTGAEARLYEKMRTGLRTTSSQHERLLVAVGLHLEQFVRPVNETKPNTREQYRKAFELARLVQICEMTGLEHSDLDCQLAELPPQVARAATLSLTARNCNDPLIINNDFLITTRWDQKCAEEEKRFDAVLHAYENGDLIPLEWDS
jgi:hypothetical protein